MFQNSGPYPMQLVVVSAVRNAVRAATKTFTTTSMTFGLFFIFLFLIVRKFVEFESTSYSFRKFV